MIIHSQGVEYDLLDYKVLVACEFSGIVRDAFVKRGIMAISCDLVPSRANYGPHIIGDIKPLLDHPFDLIVAHPPCTYLCNSGSRWLYKGKYNEYINKDRIEKLTEAINFFKLIQESKSKRIAIENPTMHGIASYYIGKPEFCIQPWQFGHNETKRTCFWTKNLPNLIPTQVVSGRENRVHKLPPTSDRSNLRSITYTGIAKAIAKQWGDLLTIPLQVGK